MRNKIEFTKQLVDELSKIREVTVDFAKLYWWFNLRNTGGFRLTDEGYHVLAHELKHKHYEFPVKNTVRFTPEVMLALDRKLQMPYYIKMYSGMVRSYSVIFFGDQEAMLINLYGDLIKFLDNYSVD